jgi:ABC-type antimicrobial peptide transport system permease subunit
MEASAPELLSLTMLQGSRAGLKDINSILLSESVSKTLFGNMNALGKVLSIDNKMDVKVAGVYKDLVGNTSFNNMGFIAHLDLYVKNPSFSLDWVNNWLKVFVQLDDNVKIEAASNAIKNAKLKHYKQYNAQLFLHPLSKWHLYSNFENGINTGGQIEFVWLFGIIGFFVLLLACINFMNLSTARSEKRAKEVGVRKAIGSARQQLIAQFFSESLLVVFLAFCIAIILVQLSLPLFNDIAGKKLTILWANPLFWLVSVCFIGFTTLISGSYPAFYLSSFKPVKVLKGTFKVGRFAAVPRKILVTIQFTVSITLIIATVVVYKQIQFAKNRPAGYNLNGLITIPIKTPEVGKNYEAFRNALLSSAAVSEVSKSECSVTNMWWSDSGFEWKGKDPNFQDNIYRGAIDHEFGKTVGWKIKEGRDFLRKNLSDSTAIILNEAAVKYMSLKNPIGETIKAYGKNYTVIGIVKDMVSQSLYRPAQQTIFLIGNPYGPPNFINVRINPERSVSKALNKIESVFKKLNAATPFEYNFTDDEFAEKYEGEERIGNLAGIFATLAIFISCLGLFGLASFVAEQRTKEIGIRKVLGASVLNLWRMLSHDFVVLVIISCFLAVPIAYFYLQDWLSDYEYRTKISWWIFVLAGAGALIITLLTVSFQAIKAALANPIKSLRTE